MARQKSIFIIQGTLGGLNFYQGPEGNIVRQKSSLNKKTMQRNPAFARTLLRSREFGYAGKNMQLIYGALKPWVRPYSDCRMSGRLTQQLLTIKNTDKVHIDGEKQAAYGNLQLLEDFEFNKDQNFNTCINCNIKIIMNDTSMVQICMPRFKVKKITPKLSNQLYAEIGFAAGRFDLTQHNAETVFYISKPLAINKTNDDMQINLTLPATDKKLPVFIAAGIQLLQQVNGKFLPVEQVHTKAGKIIKVFNEIDCP